MLSLETSGITNYFTPEQTHACQELFEMTHLRRRQQMFTGKIKWCGFKVVAAQCDRVKKILSAFDQKATSFTKVSLFIVRKPVKGR